MAEKIEPALTAEEWVPVLKDLAEFPPDGSGARLLTASVYYESIGGDADACAWFIAINNAALPDSDPRKITRHSVWIVRKLIADARIDAQHPGAMRFEREANALADALESYLPPE